MDNPKGNPENRLLRSWSKIMILSKLPFLVWVTKADELFISNVIVVQPITKYRKKRNFDKGVCEIMQGNWTGKIVLNCSSVSGALDQIPY
jgi:hypothetical protein